MKQFEDFIREKYMNGKTFLAVLTSNPDEAIERYVKKTGFHPTVLLTRPEFVTDFDHPLIVRNRHAAWGLILASHVVEPDEVRGDAELDNIYRARQVGIEVTPNLRTADFSIPKRKTGRPETNKATCPHCHGAIQDFESLGYWYGWAFGIIPPYWEELRLYVFRRDNYTCSKCHKLFPPPMLSAHHIVRKEDGGEDGSRNLITLCNICHEDDKPIFEDEQ